MIVLMTLIYRLLKILFIFNIQIFFERLTLIQIKSLRICFSVILIYIKTILKRLWFINLQSLTLIILINMILFMFYFDSISKTFWLILLLIIIIFLSKWLILTHILTLCVWKILILIFILTKKVINSFRVTMILFLNLYVKHIMTLTNLL